MMLRQLKMRLNQRSVTTILVSYRESEKQTKKRITEHKY